MTPRIPLVPYPLHLGITLAAPLFALWRGDWRTRLISAVFLLQFAVTVPFPIHGWDPGARLFRGGRDLIGDLLALVACLVCAHRADRMWVIWIAAFTLLSAANDALYLIFPSVSTYAFLSASYVWGYAQDASLLWGALTVGQAKWRRTEAG